MLLNILKLFVVIGRISMLPLIFGVFLLILFVAYCILFAWLSLLPIFSWHFKAMCKVWYLGLSIVFNKNTWILAGVGAASLWLSKIFGIV